IRVLFVVVALRRGEQERVAVRAGAGFPPAPLSGRGYVSVQSTPPVADGFALLVSPAATVVADIPTMHGLLVEPVAVICVGTAVVVQLASGERAGQWCRHVVG